MRELKFRAWKMHNGKLRRYVCSPFGFSNYAQRHPEAPVLRHQDVNDIRDFMPDVDVIEQYTGLKDKNGKEIYEGDILQNADGETATVVWCEETAEWGIEWSDCEIRDSLSWRMTCVKESDSLNEVIGNIHENRDLLGGKNE